MTSWIFNVRDMLIDNWAGHSGGTTMPTIVAGKWSGKYASPIITIERYRKADQRLDSTGVPDYERWETIKVVTWLQHSQTSEQNLDDVATAINDILVHHADYVTGVNASIVPDPTRTEDITKPPDGIDLHEIYIECFGTISK